MGSLLARAYMPERLSRIDPPGGQLRGFNGLSTGVFTAASRHRTDAVFYLHRLVSLAVPVVLCDRLALAAAHLADELGRVGIEASERSVGPLTCLNEDRLFTVGEGAIHAYLCATAFGAAVLQGRRRERGDSEGDS